MQIIEHRVELILFVIRCERPRYFYHKKMCSALQVVLFLAVTSVSRTVAEIPCPSDISVKLKQCYEGGTAPKQMAGGNGTYIRATAGVIPPGTVCGIGWQDDRHTHTILFGAKNKIIREDKWDAVFKVDYIEESKVGSNIKYKLFVIYNAKGAYAYYRCISGGDKGNGKPVGVVAVGCRYTKDPNTAEVVKKAVDCFTKLGVSVEELKPCTC